MSTSDHSIWLCLYFEHLPLEVFVRDNNCARPVVVLERGRVSFLNETASALGIRQASSMNTAITLSESLVSFERNESKELSALSHLAQWAYQFTPNVSIKPPNCLLLDISGCLKLFKGLENLKSKITRGAIGLGFTPVTGINSTPLSALYTACAKCRDNADLHSLSVEYLQVEEKIITSLQQTGIRTFGDLLELPESGLSRRFGEHFVDHLQRFSGKKADPQKFVAPLPEFFSEITFLSDITNVNSLIFPIKRLLGEFCDFLSARQLHVNRFCWRLSHRSHRSKSFSIYLANPENDVSMFLALTRLHLDKLDDVEEVDCLGLSASVFFPAETHSGDLFHGTRFRQKDGIIHESAVGQRDNRLLNMLNARLGPRTCFGLSLANDHRPEKAWKIVRPKRKEAGMAEVRTDQSPRPFHILAPPRMLKTIDGLPCLGGKLELLKGPERIDFGWWDPGSRARDYFIARNGSGAVYWVFNDQNRSRWYLHGIFS